MINQTINGYKILRYIDNDDMTEVWYAENKIGKPAAIKILLGKFCDDKDIIERFDNEAKIMVALKHDHIRSVYDYGELGDRPCIIMEYLDGESLSRLMATNNRFSEKQLIQWWDEMVSLLHYTHSTGVIHRDIKPSNIFLTSDGKLKLLDFGIAKVKESINITMTSQGQATMVYMSPEQIKDPKRVTYQTDVYSLAVTFFHLITGKQPYERTSSSDYEIQTKIIAEPLDLGLLPLSWRNFLSGYLEKDPEKRKKLTVFTEMDHNTFFEPSGDATIVKPKLETIIQDSNKQGGDDITPKIQSPEITSQMPGSETKITSNDMAFIKQNHLFSGKKNTVLWITGLFLLIAACGVYALMVIPDNNEIASNIAKDMVFVQGGDFEMGSNRDSDYDQPVHMVKISNFYISKYEVTQAQWRAIMYLTPPKQIQNGDNYPVDGVDFDDVEVFILMLNDKTGKHYRLPTETEWEYAAKGGNKSKGYIYSGSNDISQVAWFYGNSGDKTHPVGEKEPNELGIYDMTGNVYELCQENGVDYCKSRPDWRSFYGSQPPTKYDRIVRGGFCGDENTACRIGHTTLSSAKGYGVGLRLVLDP